MTVTNTFSANTKIKSASVNTNFSDIDTQINGSAVNAYRTATQSMINATYTTIIFTSESYDTLGEYNNATGIFTAGVTGKYHIESSVHTANVAWVAGEYNLLRIWHNNTTAIAQERHQHEASSTQIAHNFVSTETILTAGDNIRIQLLQNSGVNIGLTTGLFYTRLCIHRIR